MAYLPVFKSPTSVQLEPFHISVFPVPPGEFPANAKAAVYKPAPPN